MRSKCLPEPLFSDAHVGTKLAALGKRIRDRRKALKVSCG